MQSLPSVYLVRHGETEWSKSGQHTGRTDLPLTPQGEQAALDVGQRLRGFTFAHLFTSPRQRARRTCELAGFAAAAIVDNDLAEWDYGDYEGLRTPEIHQRNPDWQLFQDGAPNGESPSQIGARADRFIARVRNLEGNTLAFSSGHLLRVLAARWLSLDVAGGRLLSLGTASISILSYEHTRSEPVIRLWNSQ